MKILPYKEFKNIPKLYVMSEKEVKSDYEKFKIQFEYNKLLKKLKNLFKKNKREEARLISDQIAKLLTNKK
jgi:protein-arginine kinase activator protein McsA